MVDLEILKERGIDRDGLKKLFTSDNPPDGVRRLKEVLFQRLKNGMSQNAREARVLWSLDKAYNTPIDQSKWVVLQSLIGTKPNPETLTRALADWGLSQSLKCWCPDCQASTCKTGCSCTTKEYRLDVPMFFDVDLPLMLHHTKIRWGKIFNDHDLIPHYRYDPLRLTVKDKLRCDILTDRVNRMASELDYRSDRRQKILQALLYSKCLQFPMEEWYQEKQLVKDEKGEREVTVRSGIRYTFPHPSKSFYDESHRLSTINPDTGCSFAGYWHVSRYGDVKRNKSYFNQDKIKYANNNWYKSLETYWELYPCTLKIPVCDGSAPIEREEAYFYGAKVGSDDEDMGVVIADQWAKLVPSDWGLGDYDFPVWFRFCQASEDTIIYAAPVPYSPISFYGYDYDGNRSQNPSLAMEIYPYQVVLTNYLNQLLHSIRHNLIRLIFYNKDLVEEKTIQDLERIGNRLFEGPQFVGFSAKEHSWLQQRQSEGFWIPQFQPHNTAEIVNCITTVVNLMERVVQFSSQEVGAAAVHEQSATETSIIHQSTENRLKFTSGFVDDGEHSDKRRLHEAIIAYDDDEIFAQIGDLNDQNRAAIKELGWTVEEEGEPGKTSAGIKASRKTFELLSFSANREGQSRINNPAVASSMAQITQALVSNPLIVERVGVEQIVDWYNEIIEFAGVPKDFRIRVKPGLKPEAQQEEVTKQLSEIVNTTVGNAMGAMADALRTKVIGPMEQALSALAGKQQEQDQKNSLQDQALSEIVTAVKQLLNAPANVALAPLPPMVHDTLIPMA